MDVPTVLLVILGVLIGWMWAETSRENRGGRRE